MNINSEWVRNHRISLGSLWRHHWDIGKERGKIRTKRQSRSPYLWFEPHKSRIPNQNINATYCKSTWCCVRARVVRSLSRYELRTDVTVTLGGGYLVIEQIINFYKEVRGVVVDSGTILSTGRPRFRFQMGVTEFPVCLILPAALWSWESLSL
jgi:hypothetical protein